MSESATRLKEIKPE
jgi:hypothetical protein